MGDRNQWIKKSNGTTDGHVLEGSSRITGDIELRMAQNSITIFSSPFPGLLPTSFLNVIRNHFPDELPVPVLFQISFLNNSN